jgi:protein-disulfide isomerase
VAGELTVLVSPSCPCCRRARALAEEFARQRPDVRVRVVEVTAPGPDRPLPPGFAGTPMFYRGDTVLSYGNPTVEQLHQAFGEAA